jgi:rSAM/selenodomain-associated transferase 1
MNPVLGLFAKWPTAGTVKTRLAARWGDEWVARVAEAFLRDTLTRLARIPARRVVAFTPENTRAAFTNLTGVGFDLFPQGEGDLGRRLEGFFAHQWESGADAVVVVGADSPTLPLEYIERAFAELERADVVLGPACDGGYYLLGCRQVVPSLFAGIAWGSASVLADTIAALAETSWRLAVLPPWYDVDTPDDWAMLCGHVAALRRAEHDPGVPHTEALIKEWLPRAL